MTTTRAHYENLLAPVYSWMLGGAEAAMSRAEAELDALLPGKAGPLRVVDLGAGFGAHAIPLLRRGHAVTAVDSSRHLLAELARLSAPRQVTVVEDDLASFGRHLADKADLVLCMGDTITHLADLPAVQGTLREVHRWLVPGGTFAASFRDYTVPLPRDRRIIPVASDRDRILTCVLEYAPGQVLVSDVLHEHDGRSWRCTVGSYAKVVVPPRWFADELSALGFAVRIEPGLSGMCRVVATRA